MNKKELRAKYKKLRKEIVDKEKKDKIITSKVLYSEEYKNAKAIGIYVSTQDEVDTTDIIKAALKDKKIVCVPVTGKRQMLFSRIDSLDDLSEVNSFGIREPKVSVDSVVLPNEIDLFIVPMLAFDQQMNRLGYGGGYYDKYLKHERGYTIGIAYDLQMTNSMDVLDTDVPMKRIVTDIRLLDGLQKEKTLL